MHLNELLALFERGRRRCHLIGSESAGIVAGLDLEGRLFAVVDGKVLNRVNPAAFTSQSTRDGFVNPGGDGLWPAPEGTIFGYEYATGAWRVPPGITGARYSVVESAANHALIRAEIDLINSRGLGIPALFERDIQTIGEAGVLTAIITESIAYLGQRSLTRDECMLAPWSLCQFDSGPDCRVVFPAVPDDAIRDLYEPSDSQRERFDLLRATRTDGAMRYQIGLDKRVDWIEYRDPRRRLTVHRTAAPLLEGFDYIDIADSPPTAYPADTGVRFSVYSDPTCFMEIEAAGGSPPELTPGTRSSVTTPPRSTRAGHNHRVSPCLRRLPKTASGGWGDRISPDPCWTLNVGGGLRTAISWARHSPEWHRRWTRQELTTKNAKITKIERGRGSAGAAGRGGGGALPRTPLGRSHLPRPLLENQRACQAAASGGWGDRISPDPCWKINVGGGLRTAIALSLPSTCLRGLGRSHLPRPLLESPWEGFSERRSFALFVFFVVRELRQAVSQTSPSQE